MKVRFLIFPTLSLLCLINIFCVNKLYTLRTENWQESIGHFSKLDKDVAKGLTLEFKGVASDYIMLKILTFMGAKLLEDKQLTDEEWQTVYLSLKQVTNLDPRFMDPYVVAAMSLPYEADMVEEANELLKQATRARPENRHPFFFLWYNYFFLLNDPKTAGFYLQQAAQKEGAPGHYGTLAARMHLYAGQFENSIILLKQLLAETTNPTRKKHIETRIEVTKKIAFLEHKIKIYRERYQKNPAKIGDLLSSGLLKKLPKDPYGGDFYIMENGRVYTTSKMVEP